jgi:mannose-6-phosphate isomerase-like protein (cupin superfamily)
MKETIILSRQTEEFYTDEKCYIKELSNNPVDPGLSIAQARVEPGVTTRWHSLVATVERYLMVSGQGRVEVGELPPTEVSAGDIVIIPPMCRQRISNTGTEDLVFYAICTPRFLQANYLDQD